MNEEKNKDKRLEEKEKWDAETERSLAVARFKKAHMEIEDTEKARKRPALQSICKRIELLVKDINIAIKVLSQEKYAHLVPDKAALVQLRGYKENYDSVRADLQKSLEIKDEDMNKLFPEEDIDKTDYSCVTGSLLNIAAQLTHMRFYCERML